MPRGRKIDWDSRVKNLVADLREALLERERANLESRVNSMMSGFLDGSQTTGPGRRGPGRPPKAAATQTAGKPAQRGTYKRSAAQRKAQAEKMRAYWAARRKAEAGGKRAGRKAKAGAGEAAE